MVQIRNLLFQPLTFNLADGRTLHLGVRERKAIAKDRMSDEVRKAAARGLVEMVESLNPPAPNSEPSVLAVNDTNTTSKRRK